MVSTAVVDAIRTIGAGGMAVVMDDEGRENEADLIVAAEHATPENLAFLVRHTSGFICTAITSERADELDLPLMVANNTEAQKTAFTVTVDYRDGATRGASAADRARTARALADCSVEASDFERPGHMNVLRAQMGGVLRRPGHTEAAVDLARLAGLGPAGVLCEIVTADGLGMARRAESEAFASRYGLPVVTIDELIRYRRRTEAWVRRSALARLPTEFGSFQCVAFESIVDGATHVALVMGSPAGRTDVPVAVHRECLTADVFGSLACDCRARLDNSLRRIALEGVGVAVYVRERSDWPARSGLLGSSLCAPGSRIAPMSTGVCAHSVSVEDFDTAVHILSELGVTGIRLMGGDPGDWDGSGLEITAA